ncbi:RNA polymerase sigma-70 factor [Tamlana sp. 2201CG12-4]|uniref:RNA polymerase sigma factor n=1 Tax=Tamlana sp. 2201CG12-4 TaxID=3112582 RepID=UPI002DB7856E|nr:RNA polymerase sigma-70 factor [Tamlana sp. 2201CG12-4]MEC3907872.1 RNA polymerase sigma-70 factor [Tamlana sp. 2201CG12-4]
MNDIEAVKALKSGDKSGFKCLFDRYYNLLVVFITSHTFNKLQAEDIVQQTFISFWENRDKLASDKSPKNYLYTIAYNKYIDSIKTKKKRSKLLEELWEISLRNRIAEDNEVQEKRIEKLKLIISNLPPKCQEIIRLNKVEGLKYKEIATQLDISIKTVESQIRIAFKKIRKGFKNESVFTLFFSKSDFLKTKRST